MNALGCLGCYRVFRKDDPLCGCPGDFLALTTPADALAFALRASGRHDEAVDVEDAAAVIAEHRP